MDPIFKAIFPLLLVLFVVTDWPKLRQRSGGVKFGYFLVTAAAAALFGVKAIGYDPTMLERLFILHVSPAVQAMIGLK
jgi:hypothetical protein